MGAIHYAWRSIRRAAPVYLVFGLVLAALTAALLRSSADLRGTRAELTALEERCGGAYTLRGSGGQVLLRADYEQAAADPMVSSVTLERCVQVTSGFELGLSVNGAARADPEPLWLVGLPDLGDLALTAGRLPEAAGECLAEPESGWKPGDVLETTDRRTRKSGTFTVVGVLDPGARETLELAEGMGTLLVIALEDAEAMLPERYTLPVYPGVTPMQGMEGTLHLKDSRDGPAFRRAVSELPWGGGSLLTFNRYPGFDAHAEELEALIGSCGLMQRLLLGMTAAALLLFFPVRTLLRRKEVCILRSMGMRRSGILARMLLESLLFLAAALATGGLGAAAVRLVREGPGAGAAWLLLPAVLGFGLLVSLGTAALAVRAAPVDCLRRNNEHD